MTRANFIPPLIVSLVVWQIYRRVRRSIGRQPLQPKRLMLRIGIFSLVAVLIAFSARANSNVLLGLAGGMALGVPLAFIGLNLTRFEATSEGRFYTPSTHIGVALSLLLVARVAYRLFLLYGSTPAANQPPPGFSSSPLTLGVFGLMAGYYIVYFSGVLLHSRDAKSSV